MPSPFISVICFHKPKKQRSKRKIKPDLRLSFCRSVASLFGCTIFSELRDWDSWALGYHESSDCFEHAQNSLLKSSHSKRTCQIFLPKKFHRSLLSLEIRSTTPPLPFPGKKTAVKDEEDKNWALVHFGSRPSHMFPENAWLISTVYTLVKSLHLQFEAKISFTVVLLYPVYVVMPFQDTSDGIFGHYDIETPLKTVLSVLEFVHNDTVPRAWWRNSTFESMTVF